GTSFNGLRSLASKVDMFSFQFFYHLFNSSYFSWINSLNKGRVILNLPRMIVLIKSYLISLVRYIFTYCLLLPISSIIALILLFLTSRREIENQFLLIHVR